ncbi:MAG: hypothetical protein M1832_001788 [Thelocarpon impressellum]|nr:MAG: hypothetical protein M1832_001788 [Thelocarpon impressellum]
MQFSNILTLSGLLAVACAQSSTFSGTPAQISQAACLAGCNPVDNNCRSGCLIGPSINPDNLPANQTTECVAKCDQGKGSVQENAAYNQCLSGCIVSFYSFSQPTPTGTITSATSVTVATTTGTDSLGSTTTGLVTSTASTSTGTESTTSTATSSTLTTSTSTTGSASAGSATTTSTSRAAGATMAVGSVAGLAGLLIAAAAL